MNGCQVGAEKKEGEEAQVHVHVVDDYPAIINRNSSSVSDKFFSELYRKDQGSYAQYVMDFDFIKTALNY